MRATSYFPLRPYRVKVTWHMEMTGHYSVTGRDPEDAKRRAEAGKFSATAKCRTNCVPGTLRAHEVLSWGSPNRSGKIKDSNEFRQWIEIHGNHGHCRIVEILTEEQLANLKERAYAKDKAGTK